MTNRHTLERNHKLRQAAKHYKRKAHELEDAGKSQRQRRELEVASDHTRLDRGRFNHGPRPTLDEVDGLQVDDADDAIAKPRGLTSHNIQSCMKLDGNDRQRNLYRKIQVRLNCN